MVVRAKLTRRIMLMGKSVIMCPSNGGSPQLLNGSVPSKGAESEWLVNYPYRR